MSETSKVLDVTYGTFSCRLEGFDDSVETMKTVVSFFHELAGHDRFMDMMPQAPDLDTLQELTSEQAGVPVSAEADESSQRVSLRVRRSDTPDAPAQEERPSLRIPRPAASAASLRAFLRDEEEAEEQAAAYDEDDAEDLEDDAAAFEDNEDPVTAKAENAFAEEDDFGDDDVEESLMAEEDETAFAGDAEDADAFDDAEDEIDTNDSVAAKLQRIRAVVSPSAPAAASSDDDAEDDAPAQPAPMGKGMNPLAMRLAELARRNNDEDAAEAAEDDTDDMSETAYADDDEDDDYDDVAVEHAEDVVAEYADEAAAEEDEDSDVLMQDDADTADEDDPEEAPSAQDDDMSDPLDDADDEDDEDDQHLSAVEAAIARRRENQSKRADLPGDVDETMNRMMSQADAHLNEPEGRRHRDAFAQLKAAVAATEAARQLGDAGSQARDPGEAFREDLDAHEAEEADVVSRDISDEIAATPSPLRLVPAQRVSEDEDDTESAEAAPASGATERLRRIASQRENVGEKTGGFAEFAAQKGATELGDLLEAAAAYIAFVEGDDDFSRPQVMKKVQMASADEFSREDGLRSFGRLLRQSKIIKLNNGRFQVSGNTRFRPDDKAAQG